MSEKEWLYLFLGIVIGYFLFSPKRKQGKNNEVPQEEFTPVTVQNPPTSPPGS